MNGSSQLSTVNRIGDVGASFLGNLLLVNTTIKVLNLNGISLLLPMCEVNDL